MRSDSTRLAVALNPLVFLSSRLQPQVSSAAGVFEASIGELLQVHPAAATSARHRLPSRRTEMFSHPPSWEPSYLPLCISWPRGLVAAQGRVLLPRSYSSDLLGAVRSPKCNLEPSSDHVVLVATRTHLLGAVRSPNRFWSCCCRFLFLHSQQVTLFFVVCFVHWELLQLLYTCLHRGSSDSDCPCFV